MLVAVVAIMVAVVTMVVVVACCGDVPGFPGPAHDEGVRVRKVCMTMPKTVCMTAPYAVCMTTPTRHLLE